MRQYGWILAAGLALLLLTQRSRARELIKEFEGLSLERYVDASGRAHIGYGHLIEPGEQYTVITPSEAEQLLTRDMAGAVECVNRAVNVPLTTARRDALVSFVYNVGCGAFTGSTLLRKLNAGDIQGAADEFLRWNKAGGQVVQGLVDRRFLERNLFLS